MRCRLTAVVVGALLFAAPLTSAQDVPEKAVTDNSAPEKTATGSIGRPQRPERLPERLLLVETAPAPSCDKAAWARFRGFSPGVADATPDEPSKTSGLMCLEAAIA